MVPVGDFFDDYANQEDTVQEVETRIDFLISYKYRFGEAKGKEIQMEFHINHKQKVYCGINNYLKEQLN